MFKIHYKIRMTFGPLAGLDIDCSITYPESSRARVVASFDTDIRDRRIINGIGHSRYTIESYWIEENL